MRPIVGGAADEAMPVASSAAAAGRVVEVLVAEDPCDDGGVVARSAEFFCVGDVSAAGVSVMSIDVDVVACADAW